MRASKDELIAAVASVNDNTVVVVNSVGPIVMEKWIENENGGVDDHSSTPTLS